MKQHLRLPLALALCAGIANAMADDNVRSYNIPSQPLNSALQKLADQSGIAVMFTENLVAGKTSPELNGAYTAKQALQKLLTGTGLDYTFTSDDAVAVKTAESGSNAASTLPAVKVLGKAAFDSTDPYNPDYSLPNASTATKTDTPIMETPYSIQVVPKQVIEDIQGIRPNDALDYVSGVYRASGSGDMFEASTRRGFNSNLGDYRDGVPFPVADFIIGGRDLASTERVEVLKGPASLLYGMTNPGGVMCQHFSGHTAKQL
ncbi:TonB-dependent receptor plug domain-containing protein [Methylomonas sp. YC3]